MGKKDFKLLLWPLILLLLNTAAFIILLDIPHFTLSAPIRLHGDAYGAVGVFKMITSGDFSWYLYPKTDLLAYPFGLELGDYPLPMFLDWVFIRFIALFVSDPFAVFNVFVLSSYFFVPLVTYYVLRKFRIEPMIAVVIAILFNFIPYHTLRNEHYLYVGYFFIPIWTYYLLLLWNRKPVFFKYDHMEGKYHFDLSKKNAVIMAVLLLSATWNYYFSFFFAFLLIVSALSVWSYTRNRYSVYSALLMLFLLVTPVALNMLPYITYEHTHGRNGAIAKRPAKHAEMYGLKIAQLLLPLDDHRIDAWAKVKARYNKGPLNNENTMSTLGVFASVGFLTLLLLIIMKRRNSILSRLSILNISLILLTTIGGLSALFALLVTPQIRGYNRASIIIAFFALLVVALLLHRFARHYRLKKYYLYPVLLALLFMGLYDQSNRAMHFSQSKKGLDFFESERDFVRTIEQNLSNIERPKVMQYPYISFPDGRVINGVGNYDGLIGYIYSDRIQWSFGSVRGRANDAWLRALTKKSLSKQIEILRTSGFNGIYIDRRAYKDHASAMEKQIKQLTGTAPMLSRDKNKSFFRLQPTGDKPYLFKYLPRFTNGFHGWKGGVFGSSGWADRESQMVLTNAEKKKILAALTFKLSTKLKELKLNIIYNGSTVKSLHLKKSAQKKVYLTLTLHPGKNRLYFKVIEPKSLFTEGNEKREQERLFSFEDLRYGLRPLWTQNSS